MYKKIFLAGSCNSFKTSAIKEYGMEHNITYITEYSDTILQKYMGLNFQELLRQKNRIYTRTGLFMQVIEEWISLFEEPVFEDTLYSESPLTFLDHSLLYGILGNVPLKKVEGYLNRIFAQLQELDTYNIIVHRGNGIFALGGMLSEALGKGLCRNYSILYLSGTPTDMKEHIKNTIDVIRRGE